MKKKDIFKAVFFSALACIVIIISALFFRIIGLAEDKPASLPVPEYITQSEIIMQRGIAPTLNRPGLNNNYETFDEALERAKTSISDNLAEQAGRAIWGEAGGIQDEAQRAAVVWCACNRADAWGMEIGDVLTVDQFHGLAIKGEVPEQHVELARDVLARWTLEAEGWQSVGRVLPARFLYFEGNGIVNLFSTEYGGGEYWHG